MYIFKYLGHLSFPEELLYNLAVTKVESCLDPGGAYNHAVLRLRNHLKPSTVKRILLEFNEQQTALKDKIILLKDPASGEELKTNERRGIHVHLTPAYQPINEAKERGDPSYTVYDGGMQLYLSLGMSICKHNKRTKLCKECGGWSLCSHGEIKQRCMHCGHKCINCGITVVSRKNGHCRNCVLVPDKRSKIKEVKVAGEIVEWASTGTIPCLYTTWNKGVPHTKRTVCGGYRPDFTWDLGYKIVILEVDEHQHRHSNYTQRCELVRMARIVDGFGSVPVHFLRYNPDEFKLEGQPWKITDDERIHLFRRQLSKALTRTQYDHMLVIEYLFYNQPTRDFMSMQLYDTLEEYEAYVERICPLSSVPPGTAVTVEVCQFCSYM